MTEFVRTPEGNFADLADFPWPPNFLPWRDMRVHYVDVGPKDGPVMLLVHGMPTWSYLYRDVIPALVDAGYRCIAPDHLGFGRSDKPTDIHWYSIARHTEVLSSLITALDLNDITLVCQDWGGPIGLAQAVTMPERFARLVIMNTWLHHPEFDYSNAIKKWNAGWRDGGKLCRQTPDVALLVVLSTGLASPAAIFPALTEGTDPRLEGQAAAVYRGFSAPWRGLADAAYNGLRRFPLSIPLGHRDDPSDNGNAAAQTHHYKTLLAWKKPAYFIWGCADDIFEEAWGRKWATQMNASFDAITDASHFLQSSHGAEIAELVLRRIDDE